MRTLAFLVVVLALPALAGADAPRTLRLDYYHSGTATAEDFSFDRLVVEPLPWPGPADGRLDPIRAGKYFFEVVDAASGAPLYSRGFASIYGEWETTGEAGERRRTFHESLRFPAPEPPRPVRVKISKRDAANAFALVWESEVDLDDMFVDASAPPPQEVLALQESGAPASKVDLLVLGDGYTAGERGAFERQARRLTDALFATSPFKERRGDFNVWAICPPAAESGVSRPSTGIHRRSPLGATYDAFGSERYVLSFENRRWREVAAWASYEFVLVVVNSETYGGGGILGLYATVAGGNDWAPYVAVHELGHHVAGLADEYYTSPVAYEPQPKTVEPWEANVTALLDPAALKWADLVDEGTPLPTPWPKATFEGHSREIQERRRRIRDERRPEAEMSALFSEQQAYEEELLGAADLAGKVGAFEGANYEAEGYFRPQVDCVMFTRDRVPFCAVCARALERVIDLYARPPSPPAPLPEGEGRKRSGIEPPLPLGEGVGG